MKKVGLVISAKDFPDCQWFQGPQVILNQQNFSVYFSTRKKEGRYFYSDVRLAHLDFSMREVSPSPRKQVIERSALGNFDYDGIFPFHVFLSNSNQILALICGWKRKQSVSIDMSIGIAESKDEGLTFSRLGPGPLLTHTLDEPYLVGDPFVYPEGRDVYHLFYISGVNWDSFFSQTPERQYSIMHAYSEDLLTWNRDGKPIIPNRIKNEAQAMPSVVFVAGVFHMFYSYRDVNDFRTNRNNSYKIGHAYSKSLHGPWLLSEWRLPEAAPGDWDYEMQCYPNAILKDNEVFLFYNGNEFGKYGIGVFVMNTEELTNYAKL